MGATPVAQSGVWAKDAVCIIATTETKSNFFIIKWVFEYKISCFVVKKQIFLNYFFSFSPWCPTLLKAWDTLFLEELTNILQQISIISHNFAGWHIKEFRKEGY